MKMKFCDQEWGRRGRVGVLAAVALVMSGCAAATPGSRVAQAPQLYEGLSAGQKESVMRGQVVEGMSPDAVYLAWGRPDGVRKGSANGKAFELWNYTELKAVYRPQFSVGYGMGGGYGYGYGGRHRGGYYDPGFLAVDAGPDYVPVTSAVVRFSNNRVTGWERLR